MNNHEFNVASASSRQSISNHPATLPSNNNVDVLEIFSILKARWKILFFFFIVGGITGFIFVDWLRPVFQSEALLQIDVEGNNAGMAMGSMGALLDVPSPVDAEIEIIKSRLVLFDVVEAEKLCYSAMPVNVLDRFLHREGRMDLRLFSIPDAFRDEKWIAKVVDSTHFELISPEKTTLLEGKVGETYHVPYGGDTVHISVAFLLASLGQKFALNQVNSLFAIRKLNENLSLSEKGKKTGIIQMFYSHHYPDRAASILNSVANTYVRQNVKMVNAEAEKTLAFLETQLPAFKMKLLNSENALASYKAKVGSVDLSGEAQVVLKSRVDFQQQLLVLEQEKQEKMRLFKETHPSIRTIEQQEEKILQEIGNVGLSAKKLPLIQQEMISLQEAVTLSATLYTNMLNNIQQLRVARAGEIGNVRIVDAASHEIFPVKPHRIEIFAGFLLGSLVLGTLFIFLLRMARGVCSASEIEKETGVSVYAKIPESNEKILFKKRRHEDKVPGETLIEKAPQDSTCEALRTLRTALDFSFADGNLKVLAITGLLPDVGKSFISENLAILFTDMKKNILLIDADLRRGHISRRDKKGLTDMLYGKISFEEVVEKSKNGSLSIVGAGSIQTNPSEILASELFAQIIRQQRANYDLIIIDTPPVLLVTDALLVCKQSDFVLMVIRYGVHGLESIKEGLQMLDRSGIQHKAFAINRCQCNGDNFRYTYNYRPQNKD